MASGKIVCLISRGVAPAKSVSEAAIGAMRGGWYFRLIDGRSAPDAKNAAIGYAGAHGYALLLVEDDVLMPDHAWPDPATHKGAVWVGETWCNNGTQRSVFRRPDGTVLYSGTPWVFIPADLVQRIWREAEHPVFQPRVCHEAGGELYATGNVNAGGNGSDVFFCWQLQNLGIPIRVLGQGWHVLTPLSGKYDNPCELRVLGPPPPFHVEPKTEDHDGDEEMQDVQA